MGPAEDDDYDNLEEGELIRRVEDLLDDALDQRATHVYVEPTLGRGPVPVRFRVNGTFRASEIPGPARGLVARLKILAQLDISERRHSQTGWMERLWNGHVLRARVVTLPTLDGEEDVVVRFEEPRRLRALAELGFTPYNLPADVLFYRRKGCAHCEGVGYDGVAGIHELLIPSPLLASLIARNASEAEMAAQAMADGMRTLAQDGIEKAAAGTIDLARLIAAVAP